ncbi:MAG TPA: thioredoxin family protein, partial [Candidatus Sumerlaeota bacterium]|nr:thioredoxin family protein [Candidatus Sumerlaeota bacterium]
MGMGRFDLPDSNSVSAAIYSAPILSDGRLGTWTRESSTLPQGFYRSACTASGKYLISFCPSYMGSVESNDIWFAEVGETGISPWSRMSTTIASKVYIGVATDFRGGCVYLPGGRKTRGEMLDALVDSVYLFKLAQEKETAASASSTAAELPASGPGRTAGQDLSYLYASERTSGISKDFVPYEMARQMTRQAQIPMVIYYHSPRASKCASQKEILDKMDLSSYKNKMIFAIVDISLFPQTAQQHGVFRVPCWIRFNGAGMVVDRKASLMTAAELTGWLGAA